VTICNGSTQKGNSHLSCDGDRGFGDHITSNVEKALPLLRQLRGNLRDVFFYAECTLSLKMGSNLKQLESRVLLLLLFRL
jgi:hypothetical protein